MTDTHPFTFLDLEAAAQPEQIFAATDEVGVDTEFMREDTYFAELCLLQMAVGADIYLVDPLADTDLKPLWPALLDRRWVVHSGRQDLEVIYQVTGALPQDLFDTQIAASLLGFAPQLGYANLVRELYSVELSKTQTRADWRQRPLSDAMRTYAAADVEYLIGAADKLRERLSELGRLDWAVEDSRELLNPALYVTDPDTAIERLKGAGKLRGQTRAIARQLAAWRERRALKSNRPRQWILKNAVVLDIAHRVPSNVDELERIEGIPKGVVRRSGEELVALVREAAKSDDDYRPPAPPTEQEKSTLKAMKAQVANVATELDLNAEVLAPRRDLVAALQGERNSRLFLGWRYAVIGQALEKLL